MKDAVSPSSEGDTPLRVSGVSKHFAGVVALSGVDLVLSAGETVGVFGPNGSGKTTLVNCISGVLPVTSGEIHVRGENITRISRVARARRGIVRTYQNLRLFDNLTVMDNVRAGLACRRDLDESGKRELAEQTLEELDIRDHARNPVGSLPYGIRKRIEVARSLVANPRLLLLDEPAAGLGDDETRALVEVIDKARRRLDPAILLIDHNTRFVSSLADRLVVLSEGTVLKSGAPAEILKDPEVAQIYLGRNADARS